MWKYYWTRHDVIASCVRDSWKMFFQLIVKTEKRMIFFVWSGHWLTIFECPRDFFIFLISRSMMNRDVKQVFSDFPFHFLSFSLSLWEKLKCGRKQKKSDDDDENEFYLMILWNIAAMIICCNALCVCWMHNRMRTNKWSSFHQFFSSFLLKKISSKISVFLRSLACGWFFDEINILTHKIVNLGECDSRHTYFIKHLAIAETINYS